MYAISSYRGNRPTPSARHRQGRLQYTAPQLSARCNDSDHKDNERNCAIQIDIYLRTYVLLRITGKTTTNSSRMKLQLVVVLACLLLAVNAAPSRRQVTGFRRLMLWYSTIKHNYSTKNTQQTCITSVKSYSDESAVLKQFKQTVNYENVDSLQSFGSRHEYREAPHASRRWVHRYMLATVQFGV